MREKKTLLSIIIPIGVLLFIGIIFLVFALFDLKDINNNENIIKISYMNDNIINNINDRIDSIIIQPKGLDNQEWVENHTKFIYIGDSTVIPDYVNETPIIDNYESFINKFNSNVLTSDDFISNNYAIICIEYNPCTEKDVKPDYYNIYDDKIFVSIWYTKEENYDSCELLKDYYLVKIDKSINNTIIDLFYTDRNDPLHGLTPDEKPLIYLYPTKETNVSVKVGYPENLTATYPKYNGGWNVIAKPNGDLTDSNGRTYYGLYWEGIVKDKINYKDGFVVENKDLVPFLEEKLKVLGLNEREANEFIIYWLPRLEKNKYNLIRFEDTEVINNEMPLYIDPEPDTIIRVLMEFKPLNKKTKINEQKLVTPKRNGFTVVEWGGAQIN